MAHNWVSTQVDYVLAFPQAPVECPIYMEIPCGFEMAEGLFKTDYAYFSMAMYIDKNKLLTCGINT